jgi:hypothetical protein
MSIVNQRIRSATRRTRLLANDVVWRRISPVQRRVPLGIARGRSCSSATARLAPSRASRPQARFHTWILWAAGVLLWAVHASIVVGVGVSFIVLPFSVNWRVALPLELFIAFFSTNKSKCVLTTLENHIRRRLGLNDIERFVPHYLGEIRDALRAVCDDRQDGRTSV